MKGERSAAQRHLKVFQGHFGNKQGFTFWIWLVEACQQRPVCVCVGLADVQSALHRCVEVPENTIDLAVGGDEGDNQSPPFAHFAGTSLMACVT